MASQTHCLTGADVPVCSRIKHESSSSDEEHAAAKLPSASHLSLLSSVGYKKTLRLTSEQLVSRVRLLVCGLRPRHGPRTRVGDGLGAPAARWLPLGHLFYPRVPAALWPPRPGTARFHLDVSTWPGGLRGIAPLCPLGSGSHVPEARTSPDV